MVLTAVKPCYAHYFQARGRVSGEGREGGEARDRAPRGDGSTSISPDVRNGEKQQTRHGSLLSLGNRSRMLRR